MTECRIKHVSLKFSCNYFGFSNFQIHSSVLEFVSVLFYSEFSSEFPALSFFCLCTKYQDSQNVFWEGKRVESQLISSWIFITEFNLSGLLFLFELLLLQIFTTTTPQAEGNLMKSIVVSGWENAWNWRFCYLCPLTKVNLLDCLFLKSGTMSW